jgi:hypothetical protein
MLAWYPAHDELRSELAAAQPWKASRGRFHARQPRAGGPPGRSDRPGSPESVRQPNRAGCRTAGPARAGSGDLPAPAGTTQGSRSGRRRTGGTRAAACARRTTVITRRAGMTRPSAIEWRVSGRGRAGRGHLRKRPARAGQGLRRPAASRSGTPRASRLRKCGRDGTVPGARPGTARARHGPPGRQEKEVSRWASRWTRTRTTPSQRTTALRTRARTRTPRDGAAPWPHPRPCLDGCAAPGTAGTHS